MRYFMGYCNKEAENEEKGVGVFRYFNVSLGKRRGGGNKNTIHENRRRAAS